MDRITFILIALLVWIVTIILVIVVLNVINNKEKKKLKAEIEKLEKGKNMIISASMLSELNKVEALVNNDEMKEKLDDWKARFNDIKDKGLSPDQYVRGLALFVYVLKEQKYLNDFGKTQEDIIKLATENGFELDWLINRWDSIIEDKDILKPIIAVFPKYAKDMIINIVNANTKINNLIAQHIIDTSNAEYKEIIKMVNQSVDNNKQENKFKNVSDDEIYAELKRRKANKSAK